MKKFFLGLLILVIFVSLVIFFWINKQFQSVNFNDSTSQVVVIEKGMGTRLIADLLIEKKLIRNKWVFLFYVKWKKIDKKIQAGSYQFYSSWSLTKIAQSLLLGLDDVSFTILEGWRREEIAESLNQLKLPFYEESEFLALTEDLEGYLFPNTYVFSRNFTTEQIEQIFFQQFEKETATLDWSKSNLNRLEIVILASLLEREARDYEQKREMSDILLKRLDSKMLLQVDATLQYAKGYDLNKKSWWGDVDNSDKEKISAYNTYLQGGLPSGPICNPSLDSIKAALDPKSNNYLFYLHSLDGNIYFAENYEQHQRNINMYLR